MPPGSISTQSQSDFGTKDQPRSVRGSVLHVGSSFFCVLHFLVAKLPSSLVEKSVKPGNGAVHQRPMQCGYLQRSRHTIDSRRRTHSQKSCRQDYICLAGIIFELVSRIRSSLVLPDGVIRRSHASKSQCGTSVRVLCYHIGIQLPSRR